MYHSLEANLHDLFWRHEKDANELPLLKNFLSKHHCTKALEIGCGSGRLMLELLEEGFDIEGVELSSDMVELLKSEAKIRHLSAVVHHCAIEEFSSQQKYSHIVIPAFTLQLLSRETAFEVLKKIRLLTNTNGKLYFTLFIPWAEILDDIEIDVWHLDKEAPLEDHKLARCYTMHSLNRVMQELYREHRYQIVSSEQKVEQTHHSSQQLQWYFLPEIMSMLKASGWKFNYYDSDFEAGVQDPDASVLTVYATAF